MDVLAWRDPTGGYAMVVTLPADPLEEAKFASLPGAADPTAIATVGAKGPELSWLAWADVLERRGPYYGRWYTVQVPDGLNPAEALYYLRQHDGILG